MRLFRKFIRWLLGYKSAPITRAQIDQTLFVLKRNLEVARRIDQDYDSYFRDPPPPTQHE
jgi:hypothetical protein